MEFKSVQTVSDVGEDRIVEGYAAIMGNVDDGADILHLGAFSKTLSERKTRVRHLWQHDFSQPPIAKILSLSEVKRDELPEELRESDQVQGALRIRRQYLTHPLAESVFEGIKSGAISEMSFGFDPIKFDFTELPELKKNVRNLREVRLWDTSDVNWGMNNQTLASKANSLLIAYKSKLPKETFEILSELSELTETAVAFALDAKVGRVLSTSNLAKLKEALKTLTDILLTAESRSDDLEKALALTASVLRRLAIAERDSILF